jgi:hypothetical protein
MIFKFIRFVILFATLVTTCFANIGIHHDGSRVASIPINITDNEGQKVWLWPISEDENRRLTLILGREFKDLHIKGTYVTDATQQCSKCGKDNEFIDWVYTALEKGFHTPEFIYNALMDRRSPKENRHDIYCSGCGHLTTLRRRKGTPPEVPTINKKLLRTDNPSSLWPAIQDVDTIGRHIEL